MENLRRFVRAATAHLVGLPVLARRHPTVAWLLAFVFWLATPFPPAEWTVNLAAQTTLNSTTLSAAIDSSQIRFTVASTTNITPPGIGGQPQVFLFIPTTGELMRVVSVPVSGSVIVDRGVSATLGFNTRANAAASSALVVILPVSSGGASPIVDYDLVGPCNTATTPIAFFQMVNIRTGTVWVCSLSSLWVGRNMITVTQPSTPTLTR